jgi:uncharacterized protein YndB with AHSA1/START domain
MKDQTVIVERTFNAPISKVWKALTDKNEMKLWYFDLTDFKAEPGFQVRFYGGPSAEKQYLHLLEVTEAIPEKKIAYSWKYDGYEGVSIAAFELSAQGNKTHLKLTHSGLESFPETNTNFAEKNFAAGWDAIINSSLKKYLED